MAGVRPGWPARISSPASKRSEAPGTGPGAGPEPAAAARLRHGRAYGGTERPAEPAGGRPRLPRHAGRLKAEVRGSRRTRLAGTPDRLSRAADVRLECGGSVRAAADVVMPDRAGFAADDRDFQVVGAALREQVLLGAEPRSGDAARELRVAFVR